MTAPLSRWSDTIAPWVAARREEIAYDANVWRPAWEAHGTKLSADIDAEMERLILKRDGLEMDIFALPAMNARQLATKLLIAFDNGRGADGFLPAILADCRRFADDTFTRGRQTTEDSVSSLWGGVQRALLRERNAAAARANTGSIEFDQSFETSRSVAAENMMMSMPALTDDDVIARLILIAQLSPEGSEPNPDFCATVVREAKAHFGMGALDNDVSGSTEAAQ